MDFAAIIAYLFVYCIRPHEWSSALSSLRPVTLVMAFAILALFFRDGGLRRSQLMRTPHEWLMLLYLGYLFFFVPSDGESLAPVRNSIIIYFVITLALNSFERLRMFLYWWCGFLMTIVFLAIASQFGFDPLGSAYLTQVFQDRLTLGLSIYHNPNALAHNVLPVLGMLYFLFIWRRPFFLKEIGALLMILPLWCIFLTRSKGGFLSGFVASIIVLSAGRPIWVKIAVWVLSITVGWTAMMTLPRMQELRNPRREAGMQTRLLLWEHGLKAMRENTYGVGINQFAGHFSRSHGFEKASHSSYVTVGAEQGFWGLMLFVGALYCCGRTLVTTKTASDEEERVRRILIVALVCYVVSSWMIAWAYHGGFILLMACVTAFHRHFQEKALRETETDEESTAPLPLPAMAAMPVAGTLPGGAIAPPVSARSGLEIIQSAASAPAAPPLATPAPAEEEKPAKPRFWQRLGFWDLALIFVVTRLVIAFWEYVLTKY